MLKVELDSLDGLSDNLKSEYIEKDGKFYLDTDGSNDNSKLQSALEKERGNVKQLKKSMAEILKKYDGINIDQVKEMLSKAQNDNEIKLLAEGKIDEVVDQRMKAYQAENDLKLNELKLENKSLTEKALENIFRIAANKVGTHKTAIEDIILHGEKDFVLNADGEAVKLGSDNSPVLGKDGKTNLSPIEWLESRTESSPHWFPAGDSGGDSNGNGGDSSVKMMSRSNFNNLTPSEQSNFSIEGGKLND